jgi:hypothetical protein
MTRTELWLRVWSSLANTHQDTFCRMLKNQCLAYVSRRPRLKLLNISGEEVFSEVIAKLLSPLSNTTESWNLDEFEIMILSPLQLRLSNTPSEDGRITWLLSELANPTALQHRCIDIVRRSSGPKGVTLTSGSELESEHGLPRADAGAIDPGVSVLSPRGSADLYRIKLGLLALTRTMFQLHHDIFHLLHALSRSPGLCQTYAIGWSTDTDAAAAASATNGQIIEDFKRVLQVSVPTTSWTNQRLRAVLSRLILVAEHKTFMSFANWASGSPDLGSVGGTASRKQMITAWNKRTPYDVMTSDRVDKLLIELKNILTLWDGLELLKRKADHHNAPDAADNDGATPLPKDRLVRAKTKLQTLASDWDVLEIVELLWNDREIQDEISIYQTKAWPHRLIAQKLPALEASAPWTAERVEQAVRRLRTMVDKYRQQSGLDSTDFEALLAKLGRRVQTAGERQDTQFSGARTVALHQSREAGHTAKGDLLDADVRSH